MTSEPQPDTPAPEQAVGSLDTSDSAGVPKSSAAEPLVELSEFTQRLASFGLGETPDPLLTDARAPAPRRSRS